MIHLKSSLLVLYSPQKSATNLKKKYIDENPGNNKIKQNIENQKQPRITRTMI